MPTDQYHEPPDELGAEARTFARVIASLQEEAEAMTRANVRASAPSSSGGS